MNAIHDLLASCADSESKLTVRTFTNKVDEFSLQ